MAYRIGKPGEGESAGSFVVSAKVERVSWGAIFAGVATALAIQILFILIGAAAGFAAVDTMSGELVGEGSLIWLAFASIASLFAGGFVAGRFAGVPLPPSAVFHGAMVWAVLTVFSTVATVAGGAALIGGATSVATQAVRAAGATVGDLGQLIPEDLSGVIPDEAAEELENALEERDLTPQDIRREARAAFREVFGEEEIARARQIAREAARDVVMTPGDAAEDISNAIDRLTGEGGVFGEEQREELVAELARRFDISEDEARNVADRWTEEVLQAAETMRADLEAVREELAEAAEEASEAAATGATVAAVAVFLGLVGASLGALLGRPEDLLEVETAPSEPHQA